VLTTSGVTDAEGTGFRNTVQVAAKRFKSSWVELGRLLVQVRDQALFQAWGYDSFESYCLKEIHIRKQTALKLTRSFHFLEKHEPKMAVPRTESLPAYETQEAPPFEVIEVLAQAEERGKLSAQDYRSIRESIWGQDKTVPEVRRELSQRFFPSDEAVAAEAPLTTAKLAAMAKKLSIELKAQKKIPLELTERAEALAADLAALGVVKS
jgi:hypothetical protein